VKLRHLYRFTSVAAAIFIIALSTARGQDAADRQYSELQYSTLPVSFVFRDADTPTDLRIDLCSHHEQSAANSQVETDSDNRIPFLRAMTSIRLADAASTKSGTGELLKTPEDTAADVMSHHGVETHFTAGPWHRSHPPRNTFAFRHQPLYFEDPNMERCGQSCGCLTEFTSIIHFGARIPALPYLMASDCPQDCVRALPDCPTCCQFGPDAYWPKPTLKAAAFQAAATVGWVFLIP